MPNTNTKESLDALIDGLEGKITAPGEYSPEWISGFRIGEQALADAILASQPERMECDHCYSETVTNYPRAGVTSEVRIKFPHDACPDCGQSLKGAGE